MRAVMTQLPGDRSTVSVETYPIADDSITVIVSLRGTDSMGMSLVRETADELYRALGVALRDSDPTPESEQSDSAERFQCDGCHDLYPVSEAQKFLTHTKRVQLWCAECIGQGIIKHTIKYDDAADAWTLV